jgi:putative aldouronate transport system permease protein
MKARQIKKQNSLINSIKEASPYYLMLLPGLILLIIYKYLPIYGVTIAFKNYNIMKGILGSPWVGLEHFEKLFGMSKFYQVFYNTLIISFQKIVFQFPFPIIFAILLNELKNQRFKKVVQTVTYIPHFISWVIISGIFIDILSPSTGIVNYIIQALGGKPVRFMTDPDIFRGVLVVSSIWKDFGYDAIIYLAAITTISQEQYEAAIVDGANRFQRIWHVTLPGISSTIIVMLILRLGKIMDVGHEQILMMYNNAVYDKADVLSTYIYRVGLGNMQYSLTAAAGLFQSVIGCIMLFLSNLFAKKMGESGIV